MKNRLQIELLGSFTIQLDGQTLAELPSRAAEALSIYLVCHDQPISRENLAELTLEPGEHTLRLLLGDHLHIPHDPPVMSDSITIVVE